MIQKIKCFFGSHTWLKTPNYGRKCSSCLKTKKVIQAMMEEDLIKMAEQGKISYTGALSAMKKGYLEKSDFELKDDIIDFLNNIDN